MMMAKAATPRNYELYEPSPHSNFSVLWVENRRCYDSQQEEGKSASNINTVYGQTRTNTSTGSNQECQGQSQTSLYCR